MPVLDGYNATRAIRKDEDRQVREVLVIAMTASAIRGDREKCLEAGMNDYLAKPVRQAALKEMLDEYLNRTRAAQHAISAESNDVATPGDRVNMEAAKAPIKAVTPTRENSQAETGLSVDTSQAQKEGNSNGNGEETNGVTSPIPSIIVSPTESNDPALVKPRKKRIPLKGSKKHVSNGTQDSAVQTNGGAAPASGPNQKEDEKRPHSPPSGVVETEVLGKVSTEIVSPKENVPSKEEIESLLAKTASEQARNADEEKSPSSSSTGKT